MSVYLILDIVEYIMYTLDFIVSLKRTDFFEQVVNLAVLKFQTVTLVTESSKNHCSVN